MDSRRQASLLWGAVGGLSFLVLVQAYHLAGGAFVGWPVLVGLFLVVSAATAGATHWLRPRLAARNERS